MTAKIRIIHAQDFLKATPEGELDFEESKRILLEIATVVVPQDDYELIIDTRKAHSVMSPTNLWHLAKEISTFGEKFRRKTAVISPVNVLIKRSFLNCALTIEGIKYMPLRLMRKR